MPNTVTPIETRNVGRWSLAFSHMNDFDGTPLGVLVELCREGKVCGRLSGSVRAGDSEAVERLFARAAQWIREYEQRPHSGHTGFGDL